MPIPTAETPPEGLDAYWLGVWRHALKVLKAQKTWEWEQHPWLVEYLDALMAAREARELGKGADWDRHATRALKLADKLILTPEAKKRHGIFDADEEEDPLGGLDELAARRAG